MIARVDAITRLSRGTAVLLLCAVGAMPVAAQRASVAMVIDLQGKATVSSHGRTRDVVILDELEPGSRIQLAVGGTLAILYLDAGEEFVFKGPASIDCLPGQPENADGAKPERRSSMPGKGDKPVRIKPAGVTQAGMVFRGPPADRGIQLASLRGTQTLEARPRFHWNELEPGLQYGFELSDETGRVIFEAQVSATSMELPATVPLKEGAPYTWEVSARLPDGRKYSSSAEFAVATADLRAQAEALRPAESAALSTRIAYAAWLDQMELKDEARKYWTAASAERPDDSRLKALARN